MSTGPTTPQQDDGTGVEANRPMMREHVQFPRLELPAVPTFPRPLIPADELPVQQPLGDAPADAWQSPFPTPEATNTYAFQVVPPPPPVDVAPPPRHEFPRSAHATFCAMPAAAAQPAPAPAQPQPTPAQPQPAQPAPAQPQPAPAPRTSVPPMAPAPGVDAGQDGDVAAADAPTDVSRVALVLLVVAAALLVWASRMAFSPALLGMSALLLSEAGIALALTGAKRPTSAVVAAGGALVLGLLALKGAFAGFGEMAFVASLFVLVAALPTLLLLGALEFVLRKRSSESPANVALRAGTRIRFGAASLLLVTGYLAKDSFSAKPDTYAAFVIVALAVLGVVQVLRGSGRAARA